LDTNGLPQFDGKILYLGKASQSNVRMQIQMKQHSGSRLGFTQIPMKIHSSEQIVISILVPKFMLLRKHPKINLKLRAPLELENLLPFNLEYRIYDKNTNQNWRSYLRKGGIMPVHSVELGHFILLNVEVQDTGDSCSISRKFWSPYIERQSSSQVNSPSLTQMDIPTSRPKTVLCYWISLAKDWT
jgi:hypothetical protein